MTLTNRGPFPYTLETESSRGRGGLLTFLEVEGRRYIDSVQAGWLVRPFVDSSFLRFSLQSSQGQMAPFKCLLGHRSELTNWQSGIEKSTRMDASKSRVPVPARAILFVFRIWLPYFIRYALYFPGKVEARSRREGGNIA